MKNENIPFANRVNNFNRELSLDSQLPDNVVVLNPFKDPDTFDIASAFYDKYYNDYNKRKLNIRYKSRTPGSGNNRYPVYRSETANGTMRNSI